jgi:DUF1680 family protein
LLQFFPNRERYASEIEQVLYNVIMAAQAQNGSIRYHSNLDGQKEEPQCANTCCEVMGVPFIARIPQFLYSLADDGIFINLFAASSVVWTQSGTEMTLQMETRFPFDQSATIKLSCSEPVGMSMRIRIPSWSACPVSIHVNGEHVLTGEPGGYAELNRTWVDRDEVCFDLPMSTRLVRYCGFDQDPIRDRYALMYGPLLMALVGATDLDVSAKDLPEKLAPSSIVPLHFAIDGRSNCTYMPYWQVEGEFTCFPTLRS